MSTHDAAWYTRQPVPERLLRDLGRSPALDLSRYVPKIRNPVLSARDLYALALAANGTHTGVVRERLQHARWALRARNTTHAVALAIRAGLL